jgi:hypothetical protein
VGHAVTLQHVSEAFGPGHFRHRQSPSFSLSPPFAGRGLG